MSDVEMMKEELQVKSQQLDEKEQETILLKEEIERMKENLSSSLEETLDRYYVVMLDTIQSVVKSLRST